LYVYKVKINKKNQKLKIRNCRNRKNNITKDSTTANDVILFKSLSHIPKTTPKHNFSKKTQQKIVSKKKSNYTTICLQNFINFFKALIKQLQK